MRYAMRDVRHGVNKVRHGESGGVSHSVAAYYLLIENYGIAHGAHRWAGRLLNAANRHTPHTAYCLRKDKHDKEFCRFDFPKEAHAVNTHVHFYCEKVDGGVRWRVSTFQ